MTQPVEHNVNQWLVKLYALHALKFFVASFTAIIFWGFFIICCNYPVYNESIVLGSALIINYVIGSIIWFRLRNILRDKIDSLTTKEILWYKIVKSAVAYALFPALIASIPRAVNYATLALYGKITKQYFSKYNIFGSIIIFALPITLLIVFCISPHPSQYIVSTIIVLLIVARFIVKNLEKTKAFYYDSNNGEDATRKAALLLY